jgi:hypothetical protein
MRHPYSKQQQHLSQKLKQQRLQPHDDVLSNKYQSKDRTPTTNKAQPPMSPQTPISRPSMLNLRTTPQAIPGRHEPVPVRGYQWTEQCSDKRPFQNRDDDTNSSSTSNLDDGTEQHMNSSPNKQTSCETTTGTHQPSLPTSSWRDATLRHTSQHHQPATPPQRAAVDDTEDDISFAPSATAQPAANGVNISLHDSKKTRQTYPSDSSCNDIINQAPPSPPSTNDLFSSNVLPAKRNT